MDDSLMLATIRVDTWNVLNMRHITRKSKRWDYLDIPCGGTQIKGSAHIAEGDNRLRKRPTSTHQWWQNLTMSYHHCNRDKYISMA